MRKQPAFAFCMIIAGLSLFAACLSEPLLWEVNYYRPGIYFLVALPFVFLSFAILATPIVIGGLFLWSAIFRRKGIALLLPFAISLISGSIVIFINTTNWWLHYNDWRFGSARQELVCAITANPPVADTEPKFLGIAVPGSSGSHLSIGWEPAYFKMTDKGPLVLFLTFEGIPDGFSGFLYAPPGTDPKAAWPELDLEWSDVWDEERHIYFVGNR